jgi:hypothetical protein
MAASGQENGQIPDARGHQDRGCLMFLGRHRTPFQGLIDALAWTVAITFATLFRYDFNVPPGASRGLTVLVPTAMVIQMVAGLVCGLYTGRSRFGSFEAVMSGPWS